MADYRLSSAHCHSNLCDGKNTLQDMALAAWKQGEETTEVIIGAMKNSREETVYEIADEAYHIMVLMVEMGIGIEDITRELEKRHVIDHKVKQETMQ